MSYLNPESVTRPYRPRSIPVILFLALLVCVGGAVIVPALAGAVIGYQELQEQNHEYAIVHYQRGLGYLAENYPELAVAEFQISLRFDDGFDPARQKLDEIQTKLAKQTDSIARENAITGRLLSEAQGYLAKKEWSNAITRLEQLKSVDGNFQTQVVKDSLFQAYYENGKEAVKAGQIELAREKFEAALTIRKDPLAQRERDLANLYLDAQLAVGYDWVTAIQKFSALYQQDPNYDDVKRRLTDAYETYGDRAAKSSAWCLAEREYRGAASISTDAQLAQKRDNAAARCRQAFNATPTPTASALTTTLSITTTTTSGENYRGVVTTVTTQACAGIGDISGVVRDALGSPLTGFYVAYEGDNINRITSRTDANGQYKFTLGKESALLRLFVLGADGKTPAGTPVNLQYPGGTNSNCHIVLEWQRVQ